MAKHRNEDSFDEGSLEEITTDDFKQQSRSRVWMRDLMRYPVNRNYNQDLYSFAWAQAVQNKPLGLDVKPEEDEIEYEINDDENENEGGVEDKIEKEEGEIEEGEVELGSESANCELVNLEADVEKNEVTDIEKDLDIEEKEEEISEFDKQFGVILEELETITVEEAESSFEEVCSRLQKCFASLKLMFSQGHGPVLDVLAQQAFMGIQTVYSAFSSGNLKKNHQNEERLLRFLIHIKNQYSACLTPEQVKELDVKLHKLASESVSTGKTTEKAAIIAEKPISYARGGQSFGNNTGNCTLGKLEVPTSRSRVDFSPLLNLHADYDEDSLPSPTRDNTPPLTMLKPIGFGKEESPFAQPIALRNMQPENGTPHHYVTDAFKAVSSYQQKHGKNTVLTSTRLPSPTPSEDGNGGDDDMSGEVSSFPVAGNVRAGGPSSASQLASISSSAGFQMLSVYSSGGMQMPPVNSSGSFQMAPAYCSAGPLEPNPIVKVSVKSRDPRLRFMNSEVGAAGFTAAGPVNSRKHKAVEESLPVEDNLKKQKMIAADNGMVVSQKNSGVHREVGIERRLDANNNFNGLHGGSISNTLSGNAPVVSLPSLLKDIAVHPTMLINLLKMEQQLRAAGKAQQNASGAISSSSDVGKNPTSKPQMLPQTSSTTIQSDMGKIRMKPRDPRRVLHSNIETSGSEPVKIIGSLSDVRSSKDHSPVREQGEQFQASVPSSAGTQRTLLTVSSKLSDNPTEPTTVPRVCSQGETASTSKSENPWGDVDHLLDGYDDQQKAAIQKERTRRIEEQNRMFAARKLCLVLDLDHTLLNSAKFVEVDPIHDEILRKKEEQDRQRPERHLFRFPHMGMWTKLRPGIWRFLEKASQLYELHLYTMGNKLYATEMAKVLDPKGTLFSGRVISKGDDDDPIDGEERVPKSKDLDGVLGMESAVVIIDDSLRVWPHNKHNLIVVERYTYFPSSRRQFGLAGPSLLEIDHDERPEAGTLASSLAVIERLHQIFFSHCSLNEVDIRNILASEQRNILAGCKIVFSRVFPVGEANPHLHPLWQTAEQFGAQCTNQIDEKVTHVVANSRGTDKVNWALSTGRFVVYPGWVEASALLYRRANEHDFTVKA